MVILGERHLRAAVQDYVLHYHEERNHQGLDNELISNSTLAANDDGAVVCDERLGGLLKYYRRAA